MIEPTPHYAGELAYFDTISAGMVPVKVIKVLDADNITFRVTAKRRAYDRGEILTASTPWVCPRESVYVRDGKFRIRMNYKWMPSQQATPLGPVILMDAWKAVRHDRISRP